MRSQVSTLMLLALLAGAPVLAGDHDHGKSGGKGHGSVFCPHCGEACYPTVTKGKETRVCFETESKTICIPKVRFPWQGAGLNLSFRNSHGKGKGKASGGCMDCGGTDGNCLPTRCGHTKDVNVLIKHEYECSVCKYTWDPGKFKNDAKHNAKNEWLHRNAVAEPPLEAPSVEARRDVPGEFSPQALRTDQEPAVHYRTSFFTRFFKE